ncbi:MAG: dockerin type I domain-containing protein [Candidatus Bathyarchaeia archaeon]
MKKIRVPILMYSILLLLTSLMLTQPKASASENLAELKIINPNTNDNKFVFNPNYTKVGDTFVADVRLFNVTGLFGWQVNITYNPNHIRVKDIYTPPDHILSGQTTLPVQKIIDNQVGYVVWGLTLGPGGKPVNGTGKLCQILFEIIKSPQKGEILRSLIHIDRQGTYNTQILDKNAEEIPFQPCDGEYDFSWPVKYPPPVLKVTPNKIMDPLLTPSNDVSFNITIVDANIIKTIYMKVTFNSTVLRAENLIRGDILPPDAQLLYSINNELGQAVVHTMVGGFGLNGTGSLVRIVFHIISNGTSEVKLEETVLMNAYGEQVEHTVEDGLFSNIFIAKIAVSPREIVDPSLVPPSKFNLNVTIDDVEDLYEYSITLTFNPTVLSCIGIIFTEPLNESNFIPNFKVDNTVGYVQIQVKYYGPAALTLTEPTTIVIVTMRVRGLGYSPLKFVDVELKGFEGDLLPYEAYDGYFLSITRDIAIVEVEIFPESIYGGQAINISITIKNQGDIPETFDLIIYANASTIIVHRVKDLASNETFQINFTWSTESMRCGAYVITCFIPPVPYEKDITNNEMIGGTVLLKLIGDVNGDRVVNMIDVVLVIQSFASYPGHPRWLPQADLNFDGKVDMKDVTLVLTNFGRSY